VFSPSLPVERSLLSVGDDDQHSVAIYNIAGAGGLVCSSKVDPDKMYDAAWKDEGEFALAGLKCVKFFQIQGQNFTSAKGLYGSLPVTAMFCCNFAFKSKTFLTGTPKGELVQWNGRTVGKAHKGHTDALWAIENIQAGTMVMTGGNDGIVLFWDQTMAQKKKIDLNPMSSFPAGIRSLAYHEQNKTILAGTRGSEIIEIGDNG